MRERALASHSVRQQVGGPQRWPLASLSDNHHGHHSPAQPPPPTTDALVAAAAAAAASLADDQALVAAAAAGLAPQLPLPLQQQPLHLANGAAPSAGGAGHPPQGAAPHLSGKSQAPTSFTIVQEKLLVPRRLCQAHMPEMVVDNTTVFMRLLTMQCGANGQCLSMSRERVQLTFKANHSYVSVTLAGAPARCPWVLAAPGEPARATLRLLLLAARHGDGSRSCGHPLSLLLRGRPADPLRALRPVRRSRWWAPTRLPCWASASSAGAS